MGPVRDATEQCHGECCPCSGGQSLPGALLVQPKHLLVAQLFKCLARWQVKRHCVEGTRYDTRDSRFAGPIKSLLQQVIGALPGIAVRQRIPVDDNNTNLERAEPDKAIHQSAGIKGSPGHWGPSLVGGESRSKSNAGSKATQRTRRAAVTAVARDRASPQAFVLQLPHGGCGNSLHTVHGGCFGQDKHVGANLTEGLRFMQDARRVNHRKGAHRGFV